jgi:2-polyprenyl-3-methyl-5-hydroxy-6-metoxy-1,4-benzoquinol methylase
MAGNKKTVVDYYDGVAKKYHEQYYRKKLHDYNTNYPANFFRLQMLLNSFINKKIRSVIEVGVGEGTPLATLAKAGIDVWGFDISEEMVKKSKQRMIENGMDPDKIFWGDIQDPTSYSHALKGGQFDGLMAMGVMPHIENDDMVLENISTLVKPGGTVFIEFRNKLFSLFTQNRHTKEFILNDLLAGVNNELKKFVSEELEARLRMDMPEIRDFVEGTKTMGYDAIPSRFHNPFEVFDLFERHHFTDIKLRWYHYHPAMPYLEKKAPELFREEALRLEHESSNWRGFFLCSAFVVEAVKGEE